jgi:hypothetical protein
METEQNLPPTPLDASLLAAEAIVSQLIFYAVLQDPDVNPDLAMVLPKAADLTDEAVLLLATQRLEPAEA